MLFLLKSKDAIMDHYIIDGISVFEVGLGLIAFLCLTDRLSSHTGYIWSDTVYVGSGSYWWSSHYNLSSFR